MPMEHIKVELLTKNLPDAPDNNRRVKKKSYRRVRVIFSLIIFLLVLAVIFSYETITSDTSFESSRDNGSIFTQLRQFIGVAPRPLLNQENDRINVLLLGHGGAGHDGPELTDTIMIASIKPSTREAALVSIPRDLVVNMHEYGWRKVNHANAFGESQNPGYGPAYASEIIAEAFGIPIPYYIKINFDGLEQIVDTLGKLKIDIKNSFTDYQYPTEDFFTTTIAFEAGPQKLNGEEVLQFVRSRHGTNGEASDFARAARQQLVLESIKDQALSLDLILKPRKISSYLQIIDDNMVTNLKTWEISRLAGIAREIASEDIIKIVLDDSPDGLLTSRVTEEGAYILTPRHDSFSEISYQLEHVFTPKFERPEPVKIAVRNGTLSIGLASKIAAFLELKEYFVSQITNAERKDWEITTIYKLSTKMSRDDLDALAKELSANISLGLPRWLAVTDTPNSTTTPSIPPSDLLIILGLNAMELLL